MTTEHEVGSVACQNCGALSDEPCADWCAAQDPRTHARAHKRYQIARALTEHMRASRIARALTEGASISPASSDDQSA